MAEYVRDDFNRSIGSGSPGSLGTGYLGGPWNVYASASYVGWRVDGSRARADFDTGSGGVAHAQVASAQPAVAAHGAIAVRSSVDLMPMAAQLWFRTNGATASFAGYGIRVVRPQSGVGCSVDLLRGPVDSPTVIGTVAASFAWPVSVNNYVTIELELVGASPTTVRGRWFPTASPPADDSGWVQFNDSTGPQGAGAYGMRLTRSGTGATVLGSALVGWAYVADRLIPGYTASFDDSGLSAIFDSTTSTVGDPVLHSWDFGDGSPASTLPNPTHIYAAAGSYSVTYTATTRWNTKRSVTSTVVVPGGVPLPEPPVKPSIYVNGDDICDRVFAANWQSGRDRWPDESNGSAVTLSIRGRMPDIVMGASVVIALPPGAPDGTDTLFTGEVDSITESIDPIEASTVTTLIAKDVMAFLSTTHILPASTFAETTLPTRLTALAPRGTVVYRPKWIGVPGARWPTLRSLAMTADGLRAKTYLELLRNALRASLASAYVAPDGVIVYAPLDPPAAITPPTLDLDDTGVDCPSHDDVERATAEGIVNRWTAGTTYDLIQRQSMEAYGESSWEGGDALKVDSTFPVTDPIVEQMREPFPAHKVTIPIRDWAARSYLAQPLDIASRDGVLYGILGVRHSIGIDDWTVELALDRDPWTMTGGVAPTPPPVAHTSTQTFDCIKDALLASPNMGAGASTRLPVGLWSGTKFRALIQFDLDWAHTPKKVIKAELLLDTAGQDACAYGSSPQMYVDRVTGSWNEGSSGGDGPPWTFNTSNAVVYPGPTCTGSGRVSPFVTNAENTPVTIAMTTITRAWAGGSPNRGIRLMSTNENSTSRTIEFYSDEHGTTSRRPQLRVEYEW